VGGFIKYTVEMGSGAMILWHVDTLLGNELEISNYKTAVAK
jgi:hypothetical protein